VVDTTAELIDGMRDMRIRNAILITALLRLGEPLLVTRKACFDAAASNVRVEHAEDGFIVSLTPSRN
jgi:hypothetical protein